MFIGRFNVLETFKLFVDLSSEGGCLVRRVLVFELVEKLLDALLEFFHFPQIN